MYHAQVNCISFSGFSVGCWIERKVICYQLEVENNLPKFQLNAPVIIRAKVKEVQILLIIAMHY